MSWVHSTYYGGDDWILTVSSMSVIRNKLQIECRCWLTRLKICPRARSRNAIIICANCLFWHPKPLRPGTYVTLLPPSHPPVATPWKEFCEMNGTFAQESLPGYKVEFEGIAHVHLHHSKVIILPVFLHASCKAMNYLLSS